MSVDSSSSIEIVHPSLVTTTFSTAAQAPTNLYPGVPEEYLDTSYVTHTAHTTAIVTVTSCGADSCYHSTIVTGVTVITVTEHDVVTEYTTYCPLTSTQTIVTPTASSIPSTVSVSSSIETSSTEVEATAGSSSSIDISTASLTSSQSVTVSTLSSGGFTSTLLSQAPNPNLLC